MIHAEKQLRQLPSINALLQTPISQHLIVQFSHDLVLHALRTSLAQARSSILAGTPCPSSTDLLIQAERILQEEQQPHLHSVINATGVIVNTNLGRAPLSQDALRAVQSVSHGYSNLEYNLEDGERGSRHVHTEALLRELTGAEAAIVTNNNAAAVLLALSTLAHEREVIISRGQLVEIGGGFRVPDVMRQSGCSLVEVGTTNRTRVRDYEVALTAQTALLLSVHPSNFLITGFTESTSLSALAELAHKNGLLVMEDLGSGCLLHSEQYGLVHEPTPQERIAEGADVVCFSGDKLLGGPQAGIIIGKAEIIARIGRHPLMRAVRIDKMTLAALEATLRHYQRGQATTHIPVWRMIAASSEKLTTRVSDWVRELRTHNIFVHAQPGISTIGGGSLPGETLPTTLLALDAIHVPFPLNELAKRLRVRPTPIIARILRDTLLLDPRTILEEQDDEVVQALVSELI